jgi:AcrR family transcriptional regulator
MGMAASGHNVQRGTVERGVHDRLVDAAEQLFCARGFNETSVRDIAAAAGCNIASINYYFGGKDNLYVEIWRRHLTRMRDIRLASIDRVMSGDSQPQVEDLLRSYASAFLEPLVEGGRSDRFLNLMAREMIDPHLPQAMFVDEMITPVMNALAAALRQICPWLEEERVPLIILSIVGQLMHAIIAQGLFQRNGRTELLKLNLGELVDHVARFSAAGIYTYRRASGE